MPYWAFGGKVVPKTVPCWAFGGKVVPKTTSSWAFVWGKWSPNGVVFTNLHVRSFLNTTPSLLFLGNWNCLKLKLKLSIWQSFLSLSSRFPFANIPKKQSPLLSNTQTEANVTHSLAPVDTTTQGTKKPPTKEKGEFTFRFSSVNFNVFWVDTMIGLSVDNVWVF